MQQSYMPALPAGNAFWRNWLCCMSCRGNSAEYVGVVLFFNKDTQTPPPWKNTDALRAQIGRYKQRISRVLNRLGYAGPTTGTFSMMRHMPDGPEARIFWVPQLCLFLPNDSTLIKGLKKAHMSRSSGEFIDATTVNTPVIVPCIKDPAGLLSCAPDPAWHTTDYTLTDKDALVKSRVAPLKGRTLLKVYWPWTHWEQVPFLFVWATPGGKCIDFPGNAATAMHFCC